MSQAQGAILIIVVFVLVVFNVYACHQWWRAEARLVAHTFKPRVCEEIVKGYRFTGECGKYRIVTSPDGSVGIGEQEVMKVYRKMKEGE